MSSSFRSSLRGNLFTIGLFLEPTIRLDRSTEYVLYSLTRSDAKHPESGVSLINARETFLEEGDLTGYKWSKKYLESFDHFKLLEKAPWFKKELTKWRKELEAQFESQALEALKGILVNEEASDASKLSAAKYLAEHGWKQKRTKPSKKRGAGRPLKEDTDAHKQNVHTQRSRTQQALDSDIERLGLKVVK